MTDQLHIVCLDAPAPPNYGGAIDMYFKIKALAETGRKIILHYFAYQPGRDAGDLQALCTEVHAYPRKPLRAALPLRQPFITGSRIHPELLGRLNEKRYPILLEGLHCAGLLPQLEEKERVVLRMHNEEASYYQSLGRVERMPHRKLYFFQEARLLHHYQQSMDHDVKLACLSDTDLETFRDRYQFRHTSFIPCFIPWQQVRGADGKGDYCLYHGNMAVAENEAAAIWLLDEVFSKTAKPLVIAGKGISGRLRRRAAKAAHCRLVDSPPADELNGLVRDAHINILPSLNTTGVKLKLLHAIFEGRFCITNTSGAGGSGIARGISVMTDAEAMAAEIDRLWDADFTAALRDERAAVAQRYDNRKNAELLNALWSHYQ